MPGNVPNASPVGVLPFALSTQFSHTRAWAIPENMYVNGESQRRQRVTTSRKTWSLSRRASPAHVAAIREFFEAHKGCLIAFYFYDGAETSPPWSHDPSGGTVQGRYTVRFEQESWSQAMGIARGDFQIELVEVT